MQTFNKSRGVPAFIVRGCVSLKFGNKYAGATGPGRNGVRAKAHGFVKAASNVNIAIVVGVDANAFINTGATGSVKLRGPLPKKGAHLPEERKLA